MKPFIPHRRTRIVCLAGALLLVLMAAMGQAQETTFKALFLFNFAKYIVWPQQAQSGSFVVAILGDDPVYDELKGLGPAAKIRGRNVSIIKSASLDKVPRCDLLFISTNWSNALATALAKFADKGTLIVTNKAGLVELGSCINLITTGDKLTFEISVKNIKKIGLSADQNLLKLGSAVNF